MSSLRSFYNRANRGHVLFPNDDDDDEQESSFILNNQDLSQTNNRPSIVRQLICRKGNTLDPAASIRQWTRASDPATEAAQAEASENVAANEQDHTNLIWLPNQGSQRCGIDAAAPVKSKKEQQQRKTSTKKRRGFMRRMSASESDQQKKMQGLVARARRALSQPTLLQQEQVMYIFHDATVHSKQRQHLMNKIPAKREQENVDDLLERARHRQVTRHTPRRQHDPKTDKKESAVLSPPLDNDASPEDRRELVPNDISMPPSQPSSRSLEEHRRRLPPWAADNDQSRSMFSERSDIIGGIDGLAASHSIAEKLQKSTVVKDDADCESWIDEQLDLSTKTFGDDCDAVDQLELSMKTLSDNSLLVSHPSSSTKSRLPRMEVQPFKRSIFGGDKTTLMQTVSRMSTEERQQQKQLLNTSSTIRPTVMEDILSLLDATRLDAEQAEESSLLLKNSTSLNAEEEESLLNLSQATVEESLLNLTRVTVEEEESLLNLSRAMVEKEESLLNLSRAMVEKEESLLNLSRATVEEDLFRYQMEFIQKKKHQEPRHLFDEDRATSQPPKDSHSATDAPYPILGILPSNRVLTLPLMEALRDFLPYQDYNFWIKFSTATDTQASLQSMLNKIRGSSDTIICIQSSDSSVFGSFTRSPWELQTGWYGDYHDGSFLFRFVQGRTMEVYPNTGNDNYVQYCTRHAMAVGGGDWQSGDFPYDSHKETRGVGLIIDGDLTGGESNCCATFANPRLAHGEDEYGNEFVIEKLEVWTLMPNKPNSVN